VTYAAKTDVVCGVLDDTALANVLASQPQLAEDLSVLLQLRKWFTKMDYKSYQLKPRLRYC